MNRQSYKLLVKLENSKLMRSIPDRSFIGINYLLRTGKLMHWNSPRTFNEKINWVKLYDRNPKYIPLVDKQMAKEWVRNKLGDEYVFPTIGVWNSFDDIEFESLPDRFVLKCTHDSGGVKLCANKADLNMEELREFFDWHLRRNYYWHGRQWLYKDVSPRIIAEPLMVDESGTELKDYKVFCFAGEPKMIQVDYNRQTDHHRNLYTPDWEYIPATIKYPTNPEHKIDRPEALEDMLRCAKILSQGMKHVRVDFYIINKQVYFGEMTFYHGDGCEKFTPESFGREVGDWFPIDK